MAREGGVGGHRQTGSGSGSGSGVGVEVVVEVEVEVGVLVGVGVRAGGLPEFLGYLFRPPPSLRSIPPVSSFPVRRLWSWHRWLGLSVLLPLLWWTLTALVFALRPMDEIHGQTWSTGQKVTPAPLATLTLPSSASLAGARAFTARVVEGRELLLVERDPTAEPEVLELATGASLGRAIPLELALAAARRDFAGDFTLEAAYLYPRSGAGRRVLGEGPAARALPEEYLGPRPAYAFTLRGWPGMHLYVDGLDGTVRARRTFTWRAYDLAFQLHALDFLPDGGKRAVLAAVVASWLALGATGLWLLARWIRRTSGGPPAGART